MLRVSARSSAGAMLAMAIAGSAALAVQQSHPIRDLFSQLVRCSDFPAFESAGTRLKISKIRSHQTPLLWRSGTLDAVHSNPNNGYYEVYRAHFDRNHRIVAVVEEDYDGGNLVVARTQSNLNFKPKDLSNALPIDGIFIGESRQQVERIIGPGWRHDVCGREQHFYWAEEFGIFILTYQSGKVVKFFEPSMEG